MSNSNQDNLALALASLEQEKEKLSSQLRTIQAQLDRVLGAIAQLSLTDMESSGDYSSLTLRAAIHKYMKEKGKGLRASEIAHGLKERGFKSSAEKFPNMVGVTLRRLDGTDFKQDSEKRWTLI